jgi:hypothetical protein
MSADNQQERFIQFSSVSISLGHYLAGFADGEGSFNVSFRNRNDYKLSWKISLCFNVSQKELKILKLFQKTLQCGTLRSRPDRIWYYEVNKLPQIYNYVIPFFQRFKFLSYKKQRDFKKFCEIAVLMISNQHHTLQGIKKIAEIRDRMNDGGKRKFSTQIILNRLNKNPQRLYAEP